MVTKPKPVVIEAEEVFLPALPAKPPSKRGQNLKAYQFKPGQSGNPGGKPLGARNALTGDFLKRLGEDFNKHGTKVISKARNRDPVGYLKIIAALLPKQMEQTRPLDDMSDAELAAGISLLRSKLSLNDRTSDITTRAITQET